MRETTLRETPDATSPAGADIRFIMDGTTGNMIHSTVKPGQINRATVHATVSEFWHILSGTGEIWRKDDEQEKVTRLVEGTSIDIPFGTSFQYRNTGADDLKFICIAMPKWPGDSEAAFVKGIWQASAHLASK
ncbi:MAG: cupin [Kordiimonadales bacterium]|nr:MAG: cupin [Kordiimonadales bacterium]